MFFFGVKNKQAFGNPIEEQNFKKVTKAERCYHSKGEYMMMVKKNKSYSKISGIIYLAKAQ